MRDSSDALAAALDVAAADDQRRTDQRHRLRTSPPPARAPLGAEDEAATLEEASVAEAARPPAVVLADGLGADEPEPGTSGGASGGGSAVAPPQSEEAVPAMACRGADKLSRPVVTAALVEEDAASTGPVPPPTSLLAPPTASCGCGLSPAALTTMPPLGPSAPEALPLEARARSGGAPSERGSRIRGGGKFRRSRSARWMLDAARRCFSPPTLVPPLGSAREPTC